jgi:hypothetical protein
MGKLMDRIKQGLRDLAQRRQLASTRRPVRPEEEAPPPPSRGLRSELDPAPSEIERQMQLREQRTTPPGSARQRKAQLAKARRPAAVAHGFSIWGMASAPISLLGEEAPSPATSPLFSGAQPSVPEAPPVLVTVTSVPPPPHWLEGAPALAGHATDPADRPPLFGPAAELGESQNPPTRLF